MDHHNVNCNGKSIEQEPAQASSKAVAKAGARATKMDAARALGTLRGFIGRNQLRAIDAGARGEECQYFFDKLVELGDRVATMPKTYEQEGKGDEAVAYLHYFTGAGDWYITEKDIEAEQLQAFGLADLGFPEMGYIAITELIAFGAELDLHFTPQTLASLKVSRPAATGEL